MDHKNYRRPFFDKSLRFKEQLQNKYKINEQIQSQTVFLIDENGEKAGETPLSEALSQAKELELDLVEVSPNAVPPVCKIISWSKFQYDQKKKLKEAKSNKSKKDKGMRFPATLDIGDKQHKIKRIREFLETGHKVKVVTYVKRRLPIERAEILMKEILSELAEFKTLETNPTREGPRYTIVITPVKHKINTDNNDGQVEKEEKTSSPKISPVQTK